MAGLILVTGSSNIDLILKVPRFNHPGETLQAEDLATVFGGKGANQAIAAKQLGAEVALISRLGSDPQGRAYRRYLIQKGLDPTSIFLDPKVPTGMAFIEVYRRGENRIVVAPGANGTLSGKDIHRCTFLLKRTQIFVTQLEIPMEAVATGLEMAKRYGARTLLNPSPVRPLSEGILSLVDFLVPNEQEAQALARLQMRKDQDLPKIAGRLLKWGVKNVVVTRGAKGLYFKNEKEEIWIEGLQGERTRYHGRRRCLHGRSGLCPSRRENHSGCA